MSKPIITIAIPVYNSEKTIRESLNSAIQQAGGRDIEILICDDASTDGTKKILREYADAFKRIRVEHNAVNMGIGLNLGKLMGLARGHYIIYLCGDDQFADSFVVQDYIRAFQSNKKLGVIGRYFYQYMNGYPGPIMVSRDENILTQSCCPSGMAFKVVKDELAFQNKIFVEMPLVVAQYLRLGYEWSMLKYDTVRARIHPGGNTGTKESYYEGSMYRNWHDLLGKPLGFYQGFVQIKNRAPRNLWGEICEVIKTDKMALLHPQFYFYALTALLLPGRMLKPLSNFYRHRITRQFVRIIERNELCQTYF